LLGVKIAPQAGNEAAMVSNTYKPMHAILGHPGEQRVKATATHLGVKLTRSSQKCENCVIGMAKKKNVPQLNPKKGNKEMRMSIIRYYLGQREKHQRSKVLPSCARPIHGLLLESFLEKEKRLG
jgi:hypothetical protein